MNRNVIGGSVFGGLVALLVLGGVLQPALVASLLPGETASAAGEHLALLGYNFNRSGQLSLTVRNTGSMTIEVARVYLDDVELVLGKLGVPFTFPESIVVSGGTVESVPTLEMIFAEEGKYNMANHRDSTPLILTGPSGLATFYIGAPIFEPGSSHTLRIVTGTGNTFTFALVAGTLYNA